ncbi:MAG TPA: DUF1569 domain-containing protein [Gemmatimonadaceae bacterium]|nr:DUF1569 domain-containing protein [Gemmatimonadaceae bacterium]
MPTLLDAAARDACAARLDRLTADAAPKWGRMSAPQMLAHMNDAFEMAFGERTVSMKSLPLARMFPLKHLIFYVLPFPKNAPTAREIISRAPADFAAERARLKQQIERMAPGRERIAYAAHPIFGQLTAKEWGVLGYKHFDHHLRQFGV